jgi:type VI secretion system protein ImpJ
LAVANRVSSLVETYGKRVRGKIRLGSNDPQDVLTLEKFRILNETHTFFGVLAEAAGVHPFDMYLEMCRLLGRLAVLGKDSPTFDPPRYDHDDLGTCFNRVKQYIDELLGRDFDMEYEQEPFVGIGLALKAPFKPAWLAPSWQMYVGVESSLPSAECARYLTGKLNMKIAAYGRVEEVFRRGLRGLEFKYVNNQPRVLPSGSDMTYFQINRDATKDEWVHVQNALDIAVRLNEHLILESLQDKTEFSLRFDGGKPVRMAFTLYVVPPSSQTTA